MAAARPRFLRPLSAYLLSLPLVGLTTWGLLHLQDWAAGQELDHHVHPYTIGYLLPIALLTLLGGRAPGFFTLAQCAFCSFYVLATPHFSFHVSTASDWAELLMLIAAGSLTTLGMDAVRRNVQLLDRMQESQTRLRAVMDTSPVGIVTCDPDGTLRYANPVAERIWGHPLIAVAQEDWRQYRILEPDGTPTPPGRTTLARVLAGEAPSLSRELLIEQPDGNRVWVESTSTLVREAQGPPLGGLIVLQDITERKRIAQEVEALLTQAQDRAEREALLNRIGEAIRGTLEPEAIQARVTAALGTALGASRCFFNFRDPVRETLHIGPDWHLPGLFSLAGEHPIADHKVMWEELYAGGTTCIADDTRNAPLPPTVIAGMEQVGIRSFVSVPLYDGGEVTSSLTIGAAEMRAWSPAEAALVETVAVQTRTALEATRVRRQEQKIAATLQDALRPRRPERVPGLDLEDFYQPALEEASVGGDFYDVFPLDKGLFALAVGDVSGKGLAAATQVATVRNMLRYALYRHATVADAVTELNQVVSGQELLAGFATLFVGVYDTTAQTLTYVSCGHEPGLVRRAISRDVIEMAPTGPVLGAYEGAAFVQETVALAPGDLLALYTDGISEAGRNRHEFWGVSGLAALLRAEPALETSGDLVAHIIAGTLAHAHGILHDDVCLLAGVVQASGTPF